jgi:transposase
MTQGVVTRFDLGTHGLQEGLPNGQLAGGWLADILSQAEHRTSAVRAWANARPHTLGQLRGQPIREVEFSDDRVGGVLSRLSDEKAWEAMEQDLGAVTVAGYERELTGIRLDRTTTYGDHEVTEEGLRPFGPRTDHRPDRPPLKRMAAAAEPSGHRLACDVQPGQGADAPLYTPRIRRVRRIVGRTGWLDAGDCKMAALTPRAEIAGHGDDSVLPLPRTGETATPFARGVEAIVEGPPEATVLWDGQRRLGAGYEFERPLRATVDGQPVPWTERVQVGRSRDLATRQQGTLDKRLAAAEAEVWALTPAPGRGKHQIRDEATLQAVMASMLARHDVAGLLTVAWGRHETTMTRDVGRGRGGPGRPTRTDVQVRDVITAVKRNKTALAAQQHRLGGRVQVPTAPADRLSLTEAVGHYRGGWSLERDCHRAKDLPFGLSPLFGWKEEQITGLTRLLTLALRLLTLLEMQVPRGLEHAQETVAGLYEGQPTRTTDRPTGTRILQAFARAQITLTPAKVGAVTFWHLPPLAPLHEPLLRHLHLPASLYTALADNSS